MSIRKHAYAIHRWLGVIVGVQICLWVAGGLVMSAIPIEIVRGSHLLIEETPAKPTTLNLVNDERWRTLAFVYRFDRTVLQVTNWQGQTHYLSADTLQAMPMLTVAEVNQLAERRFIGNAAILGTTVLETLPREVGHLRLPLYKVVFDDWKNTTFYVSPESGNIKSVRTDIWRFYDFFWMLHIMDYKNRDDFNNPLVIFAASVSLLMVSVGLLLLYFRVIKPYVLKRLVRG